MSELKHLPNIGPVLAKKLDQIGITTIEALESVGSVEAVVRIGVADETACYNMLYALEGAIRGIRWHAIPKNDRENLKAQYAQKAQS
jgi:DNA transformation protein